MIGDNGKKLDPDFGRKLHPDEIVEWSYVWGVMRLKTEFLKGEMVPIGKIEGENRDKELIRVVKLTIGN